MAVTMINTLYPPVIETFQPAFVYTESVPVTFSLSAFNTIQDIKKIHVSVVDQRNNTNVLKGYQGVQSQPQNSSESTKWNFCIVNGILIAEIPDFTDLTEKQQIGLFQYDPTKDIYAINLDPAWLNRGNSGEEPHWNNNQYYQVQIRFDSYDVPLTGGDSDYSGYLIEQRKYFSEWSSITLIKPILKPEIIITQLEEEDVQTYPGNYHISGSIRFKTPTVSETSEDLPSGISAPETERLQSYRITAMVGEEEIFSSDWIFGRQNILKSEDTTIDYLLNLMKAKVGNYVKIIIDIRTNNGYVDSKTYTIQIISYQESFTGQVRWNEWAEDGTDQCKDIDINQEDGIVKVRFNGKCPSTGVVYFRRACSKDHYKNWDLIYKYEYNGSGTVRVNFDDFTVGSLYTYQYSAQLCTINSMNEEVWGEIFYSNKVYLKFYEMLFMRQNRQIAIRYNGQVSSWKPTVNRQKIDTLGGRYPKFVENAAMNYRTYSISGVISAEEDFNRKFLNEFDGEYIEANGRESFDYYYQEDIKNYDKEFNTKYIVRNDTIPDGEHGYNPKIKNSVESNRYLYSTNENILSSLYPTTVKIEVNEETGEIVSKDLIHNTDMLQPHDLYPQDHWYWEREFREALVEWLNDGEPKLYRSMPEGNIAVILTDINLTPEGQTSRKLYNFSATMYEVADGYDLNQLDKLGIINIPKAASSFINGTYTDGKISDQDEEQNIGYTITKIGQINIVSKNTPTDWIGSTRSNTKNAIYDYGSLWEDMSLKERLEEYYYGNNNVYEAIDNSIELKNIDIHFNSSPNYFKLENDTFSYAINNGQMEKTEWLGYVIEITQKGGDSKQIFVNQKGYYHIPDSTQIIGINLPIDEFDSNGNYINNPEKLELNYIYQYKRTQTKESEQHIQHIIKHLIGQYTDDMLPLDTDIISLIYQNYKRNNLIDSNSTNEKAFDKIYLAQPQGFTLDMTPYTYLEYSYKDSNKIMPLIIGETGVFDSLQDWPISSLSIRGRRLTQITNEKYPFHIEEWNYYKDDTVKDVDPDGSKTIIWEPKSFYQISDGSPIAPVNIYINGREIKKIQKNWMKIDNEYHNPAIYGYLSTEQVKNPQFNTVYTFLKKATETDDQIKLDFYYQIYYLDGQWYPVSFIDETTILAAVPIYGMINYHGDLVRERINA